MTFLLILALGLASVPFTAAATSALLLRLPADHFTRPRRSWKDAWRGSLWRKLGAAARNLAGATLLVAGGIMAIPGVPGPGLLTILLGLYLVEFPGKHALQRRVLRSAGLRRRIDRLRARFGRPALQFPPADLVSEERRSRRDA
jgi:hypothetical protein